MATVLNSSIAVSRATLAPRAVRARTVATLPAARPAAPSSSVATSLAKRKGLATASLRAPVTRNVGAARRGGLVVRAAGDDDNVSATSDTRHHPAILPERRGASASSPTN